MPRAYLNADGEWVKQCTICGQIKPATKQYFVGHPLSFDGLDQRCRSCKNDYDREKLMKVRQRGAIIKHQVMLSLGDKCSEPGCHMRYPDDLPGNFDLDHIDPRLKQHDKETHKEWIAQNEHEFRTRVVPNLQILCCHHHRVRTGEQISHGGELHALTYGTAMREEFAVDPYFDHPQLPFAY